MPAPRVTTSSQNFRQARDRAREEFRRLTEKIEERLGYCDACERCDVKATAIQKAPVNRVTSAIDSIVYANRSFLGRSPINTTGSPPG